MERIRFLQFSKKVSIMNLTRQILETGVRKFGKTEEKMGGPAGWVVAAGAAWDDPVYPHLYPNRADNEAYINVDIDLRPLDDYLAKKNAGRTEDKYTYFHLISAAIGKAFVLRPKMNRFIAYNRVYQRKYISVAFVVKKKFEDKSEEGLAFQYFDENSTLDGYHQELMQTIHQCRRTDVKDPSPT